MTEVEGQHIRLEPVAETPPLVPRNGYHSIPRPVVQAYAQRRGLAIE